MPKKNNNINEKLDKLGEQVNEEVRWQGLPEHCHDVAFIAMIQVKAYMDVGFTREEAIQFVMSNPVNVCQDCMEIIDDDEDEI